MDLNTEYKDLTDYKPVLSEAKDWAIYQLSKERKAFVKEVVWATVDQFISNYSDEKITDILERTYFLEKIRMKSDPYKIDPEDEKAFWKAIKSTLTGLAKGEKNSLDVKHNIEQIVERYADEIVGSFKESTYKVAQRMFPYILKRVLSSSTLRNFGKFKGSKYRLNDKLLYAGAIDEIRNLVPKTTLIFVPTHFSNFDNILMGWSIFSAGIPPLIYGAGLNLFNSRPIGYFMERLGAYKLDRRKKNPIYLETLKQFSQLSIEKGCHYLFYPGGTRSRSGELESRFKLGLLGTVINAQFENCKNKPNNYKKVAIVPVTINYHFVLEAKQLINQYLKKEGQEKFYINQEGDIRSLNTVINSIFKFFRTETEAAVCFGKPMDIFGNKLDENANSFDENGRKIDISKYFFENNKLEADKQRNQEFTRLLADKILKSFKENSVVFSSHVLAYCAYQLIQKMNPKIDVYGLMRLPEEDQNISFPIFKGTVQNVVIHLKEMANNGALRLDRIFKKSIDEFIEHGLYHLGIFHDNRPLILNEKENIICTEDLRLLYFYHNRLSIFDFGNII